MIGLVGKLCVLGLCKYLLLIKLVDEEVVNFTTSGILGSSLMSSGDTKCVPEKRSVFRKRTQTFLSV